MATQRHLLPGHHPGSVPEQHPVQRLGGEEEQAPEDGRQCHRRQEVQNFNVLSLYILEFLKVVF